MNDIREIIKKYHFVVHKYKKIGKVHILYTDKGVFCLKPKERDDIYEVMSYLRAKQFHNVLDLKSEPSDPYEITRYVEEVSFLPEDKALEGIYLLSLLHNKTTFYESISLDEVKCFYENHLRKIEELRGFYDNLCYLFDENLFPSPSEYLFIRNVSMVYNCLDYSKYYIEKWYEIMKDKSTKRVAMNHNNLELSHILMADEAYFINWNQSSIDVPVVDLFHFFQKNFLWIDADSLFQVYNSKYQLTPEECFLLYSLLLLPEKLTWKKYELGNTKMVYLFYKYLSKMMSFVSKHDLKNDK